MKMPMSDKLSGLNIKYFVYILGFLIFIGFLVYQSVITLNEINNLPCNIDPAKNGKCESDINNIKNYTTGLITVMITVFITIIFIEPLFKIIGKIGMSSMRLILPILLFIFAGIISSQGALSIYALDKNPCIEKNNCDKSTEQLHKNNMILTISSGVVAIVALIALIIQAV